MRKTRDLSTAILESLSNRGSRLDESESRIPHTESYKGYSIQSYDDFGCTVYKRGKKVHEFGNIDDAREYIDNLEESIKESTEPKYYVLRDIIDSWNMIEKYDIKCENDEDSKFGPIVSAEEFNRLLNSVKNKRYIMNLISERLVDSHQPIRESVISGDKFKVGDKISYSMLYGGRVFATVVRRTEDTLTIKEEWTAEDTGDIASDEAEYDISMNSDGIEYIVTWEYHGHEGRAYPPNAYKD